MNNDSQPQIVPTNLNGDAIRQYATRSPATNKSRVTRRFSRAWNILKYYKTAQLIRRSVRGIQRKLFGTNLRVLRKHTEIPMLRSGVPFAEVAEIMIDDGYSARWFVNEESENDFGRFRILNQEVDLGDEIDWRTSNHELSHLWRFQLHYHEYLLTYIATLRNKRQLHSKSWKVIWELIVHWIDHNDSANFKTHDDAWHPYCISRRIPVWIWLLAAAPSKPKDFDKILKCLYHQAEFLHANPETDIGGNHLLENYTTLTLVGAFFSGTQADRWIRKCREKIYDDILTGQLVDGSYEHFERAPAYHCQILGNLMAISFLLRTEENWGVGPKVDLAKPMNDFINQITHADGEIPLFGDSCFGESYSISQIRKLHRLNRDSKDQDGESILASKIEKDYWVSRNGDDVVILDAGEVGADSLPAHAHCDLLSFEASINGQRWFVDSGLYNYGDDWMREYCRSTAAHNTVAIDRLDQCDTWSMFRMGYRAKPTLFEAGSDDELSWVTAGHDGYRHCGIDEVKRMFLTADSTWCCLDKIIGKGVHLVTGYLHLAPSIQVNSISESEFALRLGETERILKFLDADRVVLTSGWYCPRFGERHAAPVFVYEKQGKMPSQIGWTLSERGVQITIHSQSSTFPDIEIAPSN